MKDHQQPGMAFDVIGDVHGQLEGLIELGRHLGYDTEGDWNHPDGRVLVFLGDLVDRGPDSLEVAELVMRLWRAGRAFGVMGNHEYNLVGHHLEGWRPKHSNRPTTEDLQARSDRWEPVLDFLRDWPLALALPDLRIVHAVWHEAYAAKILPVLGYEAARPRPGATPLQVLQGSVALSSPFTETGLHPDLTDERAPISEDPLHAVLMKGFEAEAPEPFEDSDGKIRRAVRVTWWHEPHRHVPRDRRTVFGHYWNIPPIPGLHEDFAPPFPSGHPELVAWQRALAPKVPERGRVPVPAGVQAVCIDYNGVIKQGGGQCVGAYRHPEAVVAWVRLK